MTIALIIFFGYWTMGLVVARKHYVRNKDSYRCADEWESLISGVFWPFTAMALWISRETPEEKKSRLRWEAKQLEREFAEAERVVESYKNKSIKAPPGRYL